MDTKQKMAIGQLKSRMEHEYAYYHIFCHKQFGGDRNKWSIFKLLVLKAVSLSRTA